MGDLMLQIVGNIALAVCCLLIVALMWAAVRGALYRGPGRNIDGFDAAGGRRS